MAASRRAKQRRLLAFVRVADLMIADALHSCLAASASELLVAARPRLRRSASLRASVARRGAPPASDVGGDGGGGNGSGGGALRREPLFCVEVVLEGGGDGLAFKPRPEEFAVCAAEALAGFRACASGIDRLCSEVGAARVLRAREGADA
jgi:dynein heavy chain